MDDPNAVLERVRKLLAHAADSTVTEAEAEAFNTKAAHLIARHGIDQALLAATGKRTDEITQRRIMMDTPYSLDKAVLLDRIAVPLRCETVRYTTGKSTQYVIVLGFTSDLDRVEVLYTSLLLQATSQLVRLHGRYGESTTAYRRSWFAGFSDAVYRRLHAAEHHAAHTTTDRWTPDGGISTSLVLQDRTQRVDQAFQAAFPDLGKGRARQLSGSGYGDGHTAGSRADLVTTGIATRHTAIIGHQR